MTRDSVVKRLFNKKKNMLPDDVYEKAGRLTANKTAVRTRSRLHYAMSPIKNTKHTVLQQYYQSTTEDVLKLLRLLMLRDEHDEGHTICTVMWVCDRLPKSTQRGPNSAKLERGRGEHAIRPSQIVAKGHTDANVDVRIIVWRNAYLYLEKTLSSLYTERRTPVSSLLRISTFPYHSRVLVLLRNVLSLTETCVAFNSYQPIAMSTESTLQLDNLYTLYDVYRVCSYTCVYQSMLHCHVILHLYALLVKMVFYIDQIRTFETYTQTHDAAKLLESPVLMTLLRDRIWLPHSQLQYNNTYAIFPVFAPMMSIVDRLAKKEKVHPKESMRYEMMRFCTLRSFPSEGKPSVLKFAKAGFYYASNKDEVICYCCAKRISNWRPNDDPYEAHKRITPNCSFIVSNAEVNVPVSSNSDTLSNDAIQRIITDLDNNNNVRKFDSENSESDIESDNTTEDDGEDISQQDQNNGPHSDTANGLQGKELVSKPHYNVTDNARRNDSGYLSLPVDHFHMSNDLSEDGHGPVPQGGFASMTPIPEYRRKDPTPQTGIVLPLNDLNSRIGNIDTTAYQPTQDVPPRQRTANGRSRRRTRIKQTSDMPRTTTLTQTSSGSFASKQQTPVSARTATNRTGHHPKLAKHPKYSTLSSRIASFNQSPEMHVLPRTLAEAGFYYAGTGDCTRCFWCGIGLRHWSREDDPWSEHARFSLECDHVLINKGQEFINLVKLALDLTEDTDKGSHAQALETTADTKESERPKDDLDDIMLSDAAQSVRDMGYKDDIIRKAVREMITSTGKEQLNGMNIMEEIFRIEDEPAKNTTDSTQANSTVTSATYISTETRIPASITENDSDDIQSDTDTSIQATESKSTSADLDKQTVEHRQKRRLLNENKALKDSTMCSSCKQNEVCIVFLPCGHLISCEQCGNSVKICMTCGQRVRGTVRTYRA